MLNTIHFSFKQLTLLIVFSCLLGTLIAQDSVEDFPKLKTEIYFPDVDPVTFNKDFKLLNPYKFKGPYYVKPDKGNLHYSQRSKKAMKHGQYLIAALYAFQGAAVVKKPKQMKKLAEIGNAAYPKAQEMVMKKVKEWKAKGFEGDKTALYLNNCLSLYKNLDQINDIYNRMTEEQQAAIDLATKSYSDEIVEARAMLTEANQLLAAIHFEKAKEMAQQAKSRGDFFEAARRATHARAFGFNEQIDELADITTAEATTYFALNPLKNYSGRNFDGVGIQYQVQRRLFNLEKQGKLFAIFKVVNHTDNTDNMRMNTDIASAETSFTRNDPYPQDRTKKVGKEGVEKVYRGTYTEFKKYSRINIICDYEVIDSETGEILMSGKIPTYFTHTGIWGTYTGNINALSDYEQDNVRRREPPFLSDHELVMEGSSELTSNLVKQVELLATKYGQLKHFD